MSAPCVLVVDDHPDTLSLFETFLTLEGFRVVTAVNGADGLRRAGDCVDAVVTDLAMPAMDGAEFIQRMRAGGPPFIPIVAVTGQAINHAALTHEAMDCCRVLQKPIDVRQLADTLRFLIDNCARDCARCSLRPEKSS
jgi:two-component system KDP operon response regulator KdpE